MATRIRRRMGVHERREQLIAVALEQFSLRSPEEVSVDDIAAAAGISRPLVYHYFPGKHGLYEAAVGRAAEDLADRLVEPAEGPLGSRLLRVMNRYFDFVDDHGPGFAALLRGGSAVGSERTTAMIDGVRQRAYEQLLRHLEISEPGPRVSLLVRSWIGLAETAALTWLEGSGIPREELELRLCYDFLALAAVSAALDPEAGSVVRRILAEEPPDGPSQALLSQLARVGRESLPGPASGSRPRAARA
ncbi:TetR/AcrR family transcriptional regulator [Streptomyces sp. TP-A0874]|uniref:TetR/AcrR family transcriptional regulator n=1 Tax=Streptomyces sp. TP-A0874 TaxID=549819 RepID=UPI0009A036C5|nr:TetR/AcrR family transcriptional regulator [Streptomyces sp. TP-A0874]